MSLAYIAAIALCAYLGLDSVGGWGGVCCSDADTLFTLQCIKTKNHGEITPHITHVIYFFNTFICSSAYMVDCCGSSIGPGEFCSVNDSASDLGNEKQPIFSMIICYFIFIVQCLYRKYIVYINLASVDVDKQYSSFL